MGDFQVIFLFGTIYTNPKIQKYYKDIQKNMLVALELLIICLNWLPCESFVSWRPVSTEFLETESKSGGIQQWQ